jgi:ATP-dependent RNA helicase DeaD
MDYLRDVEHLTKKRLLPMKPPTEEEAFAGRAAMAEQSIEELVQKTDVAKFEEQVDHLLEQHDAKTLVAALLNEVTKSDASEIKVKITPERPLPRKKGGNKGGKGGGYRGGNRRGGNGRRSNGNSSNGGGRGGKWNNDRKGGGKSRFGRDDRNHNGGKRNDRNSGNKGGSNRQFVIKEK